MAHSNFVHLNVHTEYSLSDGIARIRAIPDHARQMGMPAVAMSDIANLYAAVKFYRACKDAGVKPIFGVELAMDVSGDGEAGGPIILLCKNNTGFRQVSELLTSLYTRPRQGESLSLTIDQLKPLAAHVMILAGFDSSIGKLARTGHLDEAIDLASQFGDTFKDGFFLELSRTERSGEAQFEEAAFQIAAELAIPLVATNAVRFLSPEDFEAHEIRTCIHQ